MALIEITIPSMGEGIIEASIIRWLVKEGETVVADQPIVEIATDKVDSEITAPANGILKKVMRKEGDIPKVGEVIALLLPEGAIEPEFIPIPEPVSGTKDEVIPELTSAESYNPPASDMQDSIQESYNAEILHEKAAFLSPFVRKLAEDLRISIEELSNIRGTSSRGRITRDDLYRYIQLRRNPGYTAKEMRLEETLADKPFLNREQIYNTEHYEVIEMNRMRKLIAEHMSYSIHTASHVTSFHEADLSILVNWREKSKDLFLKKYNTRLTLTPFFILAAAKAIKEIPMINISIDGSQIILKKDINIGLATVLPDGNLIVPVIKNADRMNLAGLAFAVNDLSERARSGKLLPVEIKEGTFTLTNLGMFGSLTGTPIINQPESAILAVGTICKKPAVVMNNGEPGIGIRDICILSLAYDHRVIDGALGGSFLARIASLLENFQPEEDIL